MSLYKDQIAIFLEEMGAQLESYKRELEYSVEGHLVTSSTKGRQYFFCCPEVDGNNYIKKSLSGDPEMVRALARKEFLIRSTEALRNNIRLLENVEKHYKDEQLDVLKAGMRKAYQSLPDEYFLTSGAGSKAAYRQADRASIERHMKWAAAPYEKSTYKPENLKHPTSAGIKVRSKSEQHIVEQLVNYGVPFRYEQVLRFDDTVLSADFTFEDYQGEEFYWEHAGMMDLEYYRSRHSRKMSIYEANGIVPWKNLIVTYDSDGSVNVPLIKSIIEDEVIPRL